MRWACVSFLLGSGFLEDDGGGGWWGQGGSPPSVPQVHTALGWGGGEALRRQPVMPQRLSRDHPATQLFLGVAWATSLISGPAPREAHPEAAPRTQWPETPRAGTRTGLTSGCRPAAELCQWRFPHSPDSSSGLRHRPTGSLAVSAHRRRTPAGLRTRAGAERSGASGRHGGQVRESAEA